MAMEVAIVTYFLIQLSVLWWLSGRSWKWNRRMSGFMLAILLIPGLMMLQDGSELGDGGAIRNILSFIAAAGGVLLVTSVCLTRWLISRRQIV